MESIGQTENDITGRVEKLACACCGRHFRFEELGRIAPAPDGRSCIVCNECGANNEIRVETTSGLGSQPAATVVGVFAR